MPSNEPEPTLGDDPMPEAQLGKVFLIPRWLRFIAVLVLSAVLVASISLFAMYLIEPMKGLEPNKLGVSNLIIFSILGIIVFLIPWEDYGLRIKKFGPFEFEEILSTQANERERGLADLQKQIQQLKDLVQLSKSKNDNAVTAESDKVTPAALDQPRKLREFLENFLSVNRRYSFSPSRILALSSKKANFKKLGISDVNEIRRTLQAMVADGILETRISKKGNTLYRISP